MQKYVTRLLLIISFGIFNQILTTAGTLNAACTDTVPQIKVVIDAGHGGYDAGASGLKSKEKDITLSIAKKVGRLIIERFPEVKIIYTRTGDVFVPLSKRTKIANEAKPELFISIHCNAMPESVRGRKIHGSETYVLGAAQNRHNLQVAIRENDIILLDPEHSKYEFMDTNSPEWHIFMSNYQRNYLDRSVRFAELVEKNIHAYTQRKSHGVLQNNFHVLREVACPSVLVETGYLTNLDDEEFLLSESGQDQIAQAITDAFSEYQFNIIQSQPQYADNSSVTSEAGPASSVEVPAPVIKRRKKTVPIPSEPPVQEALPENPTLPAPTPENKPAPASKKEKPQKPAPIRKPLPAVAGKKTPAKPEIKTIPKPVVKRTPVKRKIVDMHQLKMEPVFKIQIAASKKPLNTTRGKMGKLRLETVYEDGYFKYLTGHTKKWDEVSRLFKELRKKGYDGFIVAYLNHERIGLQQARNMIQ